MSYNYDYLEKIKDNLIDDIKKIIRKNKGLAGTENNSKNGIECEIYVENVINEKINCVTFRTPRSKTCFDVIAIENRQKV